MTDAAAELAQRIERFEHMAQADSDNEMAHFSLGNAYVQASRHAEAAKSFEECIRINPEMSKAWQLCGQSMIAAGWEDKAVEILEKGHEVAASKGDLMPRKAIEEALLSIGRPVPELSKDADEAAEMLEISYWAPWNNQKRDPADQDQPPPWRAPSRDPSTN